MTNKSINLRVNTVISDPERFYRNLIGAIADYT